MEDNLTLVGLILASQDVQERALARAVLGDETHLLPLAYAEAEVLEERFVPHPAC